LILNGRHTATGFTNFEFSIGRFDQCHQVGEALDQLFNTRLKLHPSYHTDLETEVAQSGTKVILNSNDLRLQRLRWVSSIRSF
jgi:hypothetical protein